jgi:hypothetical protein
LPYKLDISSNLTIYKASSHTVAVIIFSQVELLKFNGNAFGPGYRFKSGLALAHALRAFRSIPIAFPYAAATHIVQATHANAKPKPTQRVPLPLPTEAFGRQASPV